MLELTRTTGWDQRLAAVVDRHAALPGEWGTSDCLLTVADVILALTGVDPAEDVRGRYDSETGAAKLLLKRGYENVEQALAADFPPVARLMAQRGDVGVVARNGQLAAGFICDRGFAVKIETGLLFLSQMDVKSMFKVG